MPDQGADLLRLVQILSPAFPVGSFAHSQGLEAAIAAGDVADAAGLEAWIAALLVQGGPRVDAVILRRARAPGADVAALADLVRATSPGAGRAREAAELGTGFAALMAAMGAPVGAGLPYPVAVGQATAGLDVPDDVVVALWLQGVAAQLVSVAVRLVPLGQAAGQAVLARLAAVILPVAQEGDPGDEVPASFTPAADRAGMRQERMETRLFRS